MSFIVYLLMLLSLFFQDKGNINKDIIKLNMYHQDFIMYSLSLKKKIDNF